MRHDTIADGFVILKNAEDVGKKEAVLPYSKLMLRILGVMKEKGYIRDFREEGKVKKVIVVSLAGRINNCKAIRPRFVVKKGEYGKWEKRYLPGENLGILIVSTSQGLMTHYEAMEKGIGGRLIGFVY